MTDDNDSGKDRANKLLDDIDISTSISDEEIEQLYNKLSNYAEFEIELDKLIAEFELYQDTQTLQAKVILLIKKLLTKSSPHGKSIEISITNELKINEYISKLSKLLVHKRFKKEYEQIHDVEHERDLLDPLTIQAKTDLKKKLKRFFIYEIYKVLNPRRIAGETKLSNFLNNYIVGGMEYALRYKGGTKDDIINYTTKHPRTPISPQHIASQKNKHNKGRGI